MCVATPYSSSRAACPILVFSHLRWNFVYQRPQHLLTRFQGLSAVHFWEEPHIEQRNEPLLDVSIAANGVHVLTPLLPAHLDRAAAIQAQRLLLDEYLAKQGMSEFYAWYYTPMALQFSDHLAPEITIYDCMDELSAFQGASPELISQERALFARADVVFCGGASLYAAKRKQHDNVHLFPSSIDRTHFAVARGPLPDPADQAAISRPRIGFYGVIDERLDRELLREVAAMRADWHFILLGPVVKIQASDLPQSANIHLLGQKSYSELPPYLANWDVAMLPFALNASTQFISPTKTPEYLAGGRPVVSTPIQDVIHPYGDLGVVKIVGTAEEFVMAVETFLKGPDPTWLQRVDALLADMSWDKTFTGMWTEIQRCTPLDARCATSLSATAEGSVADV